MSPIPPTLDTATFEHLVLEAFSLINGIDYQKPILDTADYRHRVLYALQYMVLNPSSDGSTGATGATGAGATGATGIGATGATGVGATGATGVGATGATGVAGIAGAQYIYTFDTSKTTDVAPNPNSFHCDNPSNQGLITKLWFDNEDFYNVNIVNFIQSLTNTNASPKAYITIRGGSGVERIYFFINSFTAKSGYYELGVTVSAFNSGDPLDNNEFSGFTISRSGDNGSTGATGIGSQGSTGATGVGATGATGIGATGATGPAGTTAPLYQATYYKSTSQNLTNGNTDITFDQDASWSNDNGLITHTAGSADFVVTQAGLYQLEFNLSVNANSATWNTSNSKVVSIDITRSPNAEQVVIGQTAVTATTQSYTQSVVSTFKLEVGDVINLRHYGNFATATPFVLGVQNTIDLNTWFSWRLLNSGTQGLTGATGISGDVGATGATGIGLVGATGATGVIPANLTVDYIEFDTTYTSGVTQYQMAWNDTDGTVELGLKGGNVDLAIGQENVILAVNDNATTLNPGEVVYISGANGTNLLVKRAQANADATSARTIGVVAESIAVNAVGFVCTFGAVKNLNTNAFNDGDILYLSPTVAGGITNVKPSAPQHLVLVGFCQKKAGGAGQIFVEVQNGYELEELHNVQINTGTLANNDNLAYNSATQTWQNKLTTTANAIRVRQTTSQTIVNNQENWFVFNTVDYSNGSIFTHDLTQGYSKIRIDQTGVYLINIKINATDYFYGNFFRTAILTNTGLVTDTPSIYQYLTQVRTADQGGSVPDTAMYCGSTTINVATQPIWIVASLFRVSSGNGSTVVTSQYGSFIEIIKLS